MITEKFSPPERQKLRKVLEPYGAIKDCADKTGIHRTTIARLLKTGEASMVVVAKLRLFMGGFASRLFVDELDQAA